MPPRFGWSDERGRSEALLLSALGLRHLAGMVHMPPLRFNTANVLSAVVWAPALVLFGDLLTRSLGQEDLATKIFFITIIAAVVTALGVWIRRQFLVG
jgi:membrane protein DedA with SNARE-associated domain